MPCQGDPSCPPFGSPLPCKAWHLPFSPLNTALPHTLHSAIAAVTLAAEARYYPLNLCAFSLLVDTRFVSLTRVCMFPLWAG